VHVDRYETEAAAWEIARRLPTSALRPYVGSTLEGWRQTRGPATRLREVPFPGIPLILNLGAPWRVGPDPHEGTLQDHDSFLAGLHTAPSFVDGDERWACLELRLTPLGAHRLLGRPMHELTNHTVALDELLPGADELSARLRDAVSWQQRFELVESFLARRFADAAPSSPAIEWSWRRLRASHGQASISALAEELGWSHRRLIVRFREQLGLTPKALARVIRFERAMQLLTASGAKGLAGVAYAAGYADQAHMNRDFRELAGTTPTALVAGRTASGGVAA
jgi:AraC-like DNA-binding protein